MWTPIRLENGRWEYENQTLLGRAGSFGAVYLGRSDDADAIEVAVKQLFVPASDAAEREMMVARELFQKEYEYVIPILDFGLDSEEQNHHFIVMAKAEKSLQMEIISRGEFSSTEAAATLLQIANGLQEAAQIQLIHRDLKPDNVLIHDGRWKVADFGIARFVDQSTSSKTVKRYWTPSYAAPEQLRGESATSATDIYALGCIGYRLLTGMPPFGGDDEDELRRQKLNSDPPEIPDIDYRLRNLLRSMLRRPLQVRPSREQVIAVLNSIAHGPPAKPIRGLELIAKVEAYRQAEIAQRESEKAAKLEIERQRASLAKEAIASLRAILDNLFAAVNDAAPSIQLVGDPVKTTGVESKAIQHARGELSYRLRHDPVPIGAFPRSQWNVIAEASIRVVRQGKGTCGWSASLWFGNGIARNISDLMWFESAYMYSPLMSPGPQQTEPFDLFEQYSLADSVVPGNEKVKFGQVPQYVPIDYDHENSFIERWIERFGLACAGKLSRPEMPVQVI